MQMNGGFFGSMMPQGATSFMPSQGSAQSMIGGIQGSPNSFTSPPMGPELMAALAALGKMGNGQGQGDGNPSALPPNSFSPFMPNGGPPPGGAGGAPAAGGGPAGPGGPGAGAAAPPGAGAPPGIAQLLQQLHPDQLKGILSRLGIGGAPAMPATS